MTGRPEPASRDDAHAAPRDENTAPREGPPARGSASPPASLNQLGNIEVRAAVELGSSELLLRDLAALGPGSVVRLDRLAGEPADFTVNGRLFARGELVIVGDYLGLRISELVQVGESA